jgi:hypothetical protein
MNFMVSALLRYSFVHWFFFRLSCHSGVATISASALSH